VYKSVKMTEPHGLLHNCIKHTNHSRCL